MQHVDKQSGFTLLEVLVSTTIVGLVFGSVFSAIVASKQLDFKTKASFQRSAEQRLLGSAAELYLSVAQKPPADFLPESYQFDFQDITVKYGDEENPLQGGQLERYSITRDGVEVATGIVWAAQTGKR